jgi:hypothetical protein
MPLVLTALIVHGLAEVPEPEHQDGLPRPAQPPEPIVIEPTLVSVVPGGTPTFCFAGSG